MAKDDTKLVPVRATERGYIDRVYAKGEVFSVPEDLIPPKGKETWFKKITQKEAKEAIEGPVEDDEAKLRAAAEMDELKRQVAELTEAIAKSGK